MNIILGASGQVGSLIVKALLNSHAPVTAVIRNPDSKFDALVPVRIADFRNPTQLTEALAGGTTVFLLTPYDPASHDIIGETKRIIANYREAIQANQIKKIVGLSTIGAHLEGNTGNLRMSRILEQGFDDLNVKKVFIRPAYYFSNWLGFMEAVEQYGVLPTFFPEDLKIRMISPWDVATFTAEQILNGPMSQKEMYELVGPRQYSSHDVANVFSQHLEKDIDVQSIPREQWKETLTHAGFTDNAATHLVAMTQAVVNEQAVPERLGKAIKLPTRLAQYLDQQLA